MTVTRAGQLTVSTRATAGGVVALAGELDLATAKTVADAVASAATSSPC